MFFTSYKQTIKPVLTTISYYKISTIFDTIGFKFCKRSLQPERKQWYLSVDYFYTLHLLRPCEMSFFEQNDGKDKMTKNFENCRHLIFFLLMVGKIKQPNVKRKRTNRESKGILEIVIPTMGNDWIETTWQVPQPGSDMIYF